MVTHAIGRAMSKHLPSIAGVMCRGGALRDNFGWSS